MSNAAERNTWDGWIRSVRSMMLQTATERLRAKSNRFSELNSLFRRSKPDIKRDKTATEEKKVSSVSLHISHY